MRRRAERLNKSYEEHGRRQRDNSERMATALAEAQRRTDREADDRRRLETERDAARLESAASKKSEADIRVLAKRAIVAVLLGLGLAGAVPAAFFFLGPIWSLVFAGTLAVYLKVGWDWARTVETSWKAIALLGAAEAILFGVGVAVSVMTSQGST
jgi:hypothetical protein